MNTKTNPLNITHTFRVLWEALEGYQTLGGVIREDRVVPYVQERQEGGRKANWGQYFFVDLLHDEGCVCTR